MSESGFSHTPVLLAETLEALSVKPDGVYIDCTLGGGGHSEAIASRLHGGRLIGIDRDDEALSAAGARLAKFGSAFEPVKANFSDIESICAERGLRPDGVLFDLGVSSHQLDTPRRGFSYMSDAPLDMRMDTASGQTAAELIASTDERALARILSDYGEERFARLIAAEIKRREAEGRMSTTFDLRDAAVAAIPAAAARSERQHPAKRTFQAVRIAVNGELDAVASAVRSAAAVLAEGGRLAVITFHSLEDRIVKSELRELSRGCTCPPSFPVCVCGAKPVLRELGKPVTACREELESNPRAHSARLRAAEKL